MGSSVPDEAAFRLEVSIEGGELSVSTWVLGPKGWEQAERAVEGAILDEALAL